MTSLWRRFWLEPFRCVFWNSPLRPATRPFSMARRDWRLYSSLARRALDFISSSAALERRTVKHTEIWIEIRHFNGTGPLVQFFSSTPLAFSHCSCHSLSSLSLLFSSCFREMNSSFARLSSVCRISSSPLCLSSCSHFLEPKIKLIDHPHL